MGVMMLILLGGCFNTPQGFHVQEPGGYNFTTGNQRDHYNYERYANGRAVVTITLRMVDLPGMVYDPRFDPQALLMRIGWKDVTIVRDPITHRIGDLDLIELRVRDAQEASVTLWVINLDSPVDVWAEVRGNAEAQIQAFEDWKEVWETLEFIYF